MVCLTPNEKWLRLWQINYGEGKKWTFASRKQYPNESTGKDADAVIVVPILKSPIYKDKLVVISEYRTVLNGREYSFPAGLIDKNESIIEAAKRELFEETGLTITKILQMSPVVYSSAGMTDESIVYAVVEVTGTPTSKNQEKSEDIQVLTLTEQQTYDLANQKNEFSNAKISARTWPYLLLWTNL